MTCIGKPECSCPDCITDLIREYAPELLAPSRSSVPSGTCLLRTEKDMTGLGATSATQEPGPATRAGSGSRPTNEGSQ